MIAALLHGRVHLNFQEFRQQNHLTFFIHILGILELLQPQVFQNEHQAALWDCLLSFIRLLLVGKVPALHPCMGCQPLEGEPLHNLELRCVSSTRGSLKGRPEIRNLILGAQRCSMGQCITAVLWLTLIFPTLSQNYRKSSRHLAAFISKFVQFIQKYITCNAQASVSFLQKHSDPLQ